ncbi:MAG: hypothetical protein ACRD9R_07475 [Pyrinomonadaceae bacterium]
MANQNEKSESNDKALGAAAGATPEGGAQQGKGNQGGSHMRPQGSSEQDNEQTPSGRGGYGGTSRQDGATESSSTRTGGAQHSGGRTGSPYDE